MVAAMSGVHSNLKQGAIVGGIPAFDVKQWGKASACYGRLPDMYKDLRSLRHEIEELKKLLARQAEAAEREGEEE
jgi:UDP-3-O-[3-hydroxymyristoyl] glucosamine N-acyltransferase